MIQNTDGTCIWLQSLICGGYIDIYSIFVTLICVTLHLPVAYGESYTVDYNLYIIEIVQIDNIYTQRNTKASYN